MNITSIFGTTTLLLVNSCYFPEKKHPWKAIRGVCHWARPEVWDEFQDKFNIPVVVEFGDLG